MTRKFTQEVHCPTCKTWHTHETAFGRWIRNNPALASELGYSVVDTDMTVHESKTIHQHKGKYARDIQLLMDIEIKIKGAELTQSQRDTLHIRNQLMRNRSQTPSKPLRYQAGVYRGVLSTFSGKQVAVRCFGVHVLRFSGLGPDDSEWMRWDEKPITQEQLTKLLRFDLDPDTLRPLDLRNHHAVYDIRQDTLSLAAGGAS